MNWQKCPVCDGSGLVSRPPWVAGDRLTWADTSTGPYTCPTCHGVRVLLVPGPAWTPPSPGAGEGVKDGW